MIACEALFCRLLSDKAKTTPRCSYLGVRVDNDFITKSEAESHASIRVSVSRYKGTRSSTINLALDYEAAILFNGHEYRGDMAFRLVD